MKSLTEIYTLLTNDLQDLNQEIRLKLLFMPSYTEQEMKNLGLWLEEVERLARKLRESFLNNLPSFAALKDRVSEAVCKRIPHWT